jgi:hypothetical protein
MEIFELTPEQQKAFNRLEKAYRDCEKAGVFFVNRYGDLHAYNSRYINGFGTDDFLRSEFKLKVVDAIELGNHFSITQEWCDDDILHYYGLTKEGHNLINNNP